MSWMLVMGAGSHGCVAGGRPRGGRGQPATVGAVWCGGGSAGRRRRRLPGAARCTAGWQCCVARHSRCACYLTRSQAPPTCTFTGAQWVALDFWSLHNSTSLHFCARAPYKLKGDRSWFAVQFELHLKFFTFLAAPYIRLMSGGSVQGSEYEQSAQGIR